MNAAIPGPRGSASPESIFTKPPAGLRAIRFSGCPGVTIVAVPAFAGTPKERNQAEITPPGHSP